MGTQVFSFSFFNNTFYSRSDYPETLELSSAVPGNLHIYDFKYLILRLKEKLEVLTMGSFAA